VEPAVEPAVEPPTTVAKRTYKVVIRLPTPVQSLTLGQEEELSAGALHSFLCGLEGITCFPHVRSRLGVSLIQSEKTVSTIVIIIVVSGSPDALAAIPGLAALLARLQAELLASLIEAVTDPDLEDALESGNVEDVTSVEGPAWIEGQNAENAPFSCLTADGTYSDHIDADHYGGPGDIWYGDLKEAKERCDANDECVVLHDWGGDGGPWRACRSVTYNDEGPAHTMVRAI